jgi:hypothetical protein
MQDISSFKNNKEKLHHNKSTDQIENQNSELSTNVPNKLEVKLYLQCLFNHDNRLILDILLYSLSRLRIKLLE